MGKKGEEEWEARVPVTERISHRNKRHNTVTIVNDIVIIVW